MQITGGWAKVAKLVIGLACCNHDEHISKITSIYITTPFDGFAVLATKPGHTHLSLVGTSRRLSDKAMFSKTLNCNLRNLTSSYILLN